VIWVQNHFTKKHSGKLSWLPGKLTMKIDISRWTWFVFHPTMLVYQPTMCIFKKKGHDGMMGSRGKAQQETLHLLSLDSGEYDSGEHESLPS